MRQYHALYISLLAGIMASREAAATSITATHTLWSSVGAGCIPETSASGIGFQRAPFGDVFFASGATGTFRMLCPITGTQTAIAGSTYQLEIEYQDPDATANNCRVYAALLATETHGVTGTTLTTIDSNTHSPQPDRTTLTGTVPTATSFDFDLYYYWVDVELTRNSVCRDQYELGGAKATAFFGARLLRF